MGKALAEQGLDLVWSQWVALGVSGTGALVPQHAVDLEAAIAFAPCLERLEPRLYAEALDWCIRFAGPFTSVSVLKHTLRNFDSEHRARFEVFAAIVNAHGGTKWPTSAAPPPFTPSQKSRLTLGGASSIQLRARKIFGVSARADILVGLALEPTSEEPHWTRVEYLADLGYTPRALREALRDLVTGGVLGTLPFGRSVRYALKKPALLRELLSPMPQTRGQPWGARLALLASLLELDHQTRARSPTTRAVELRKLLERKRPLIERSHTPFPELGTTDPWHQVEAWMAPQLRP